MSGEQMEHLEDSEREYKTVKWVIEALPSIPARQLGEPIDADPAGVF